MPYNDRSVDQTAEYESTIGCIQALVDSNIGCLFALGGDFNVSFSGYTAASEALRRFCQRNNFMWLEPMSDDIGFTFHNDANMHFTLIDHFICSPCLSNGSKATHILADGDNTSDHLAISVFLNIPLDTEYAPRNPDHPVRLKWDRADTSLYKNVIASHLSAIDLPIDALLCSNTCSGHEAALAKYYTEILYGLLNSSKLCIPEVKVGVEKHWWTHALDGLTENAGPENGGPK